MRLLLLFLTFTLVTLLWFNWDKINHLLEPPPGINPDPITYSVFIEEIEYHRSKISAQYQNASNQSEKNKALESASQLLQLIMPAMMKCWQGTPWDFNGTATTPGDGKIACGYFVSTIMRDAGFSVERISLAQQASQNILLTLLPKSDLSIETGTDYQQYMQQLRQRQDGIYIIGLDKHVGFIIKKGQQLQSIHSGGKFKKVVCENEEQALSIKNSKYRVVGNITENNELILKWLNNEPLITQR